MKVRQHIPTFFEGIEPEETEVNSLEELQALEFVQRFSSDPAFYRLSVVRDYGPPPDSCHLLMAEMDEGRRWWVVAYLRGSLGEMPSWRPPE